MKQAEERVLNYTYQWVAYGTDESEVMAEENLGTQRKEKWDETNGLNYILSPNLYVEVLTLSISDCDRDIWR